METVRDFVKDIQSSYEQLIESTARTAVDSISNKDIPEGCENIFATNVTSFFTVKNDFKYLTKKELEDLRDSIEYYNEIKNKYEAPYTQQQKAELVDANLDILRNMIPLYVGTMADVKIKILMENYRNILLKIDGVDLKAVAREKREAKLEKRREEKRLKLEKHTRREEELRQRKIERKAKERELRKKYPYTYDHISMEK